MNRVKESEKPIYNITNRGYNVKAWYLKDTKKSKGDSLVEIRAGKKLIKQFVFPAYKIWNIAAHFHDIVDSEITKNDAGYRIAASDGFDGIFILPKEKKQS